LFWSPLRCRFLAVCTMRFWTFCCSDECTSCPAQLGNEGGPDLRVLS
jgi:hypothetical protein